MSRYCRDCVFAHRPVVYMPANGKVIECRYNPPAVVHFRERPDDEATGAIGAWPQVPDSGWCRRWSASQRHSRNVPAVDTEDDETARNGYAEGYASGRNRLSVRKFVDTNPVYEVAYHQGRRDGAAFSRDDI